MNTTARHVIFGTGAIGLATLDALRRRGETVRLVNRSGSAPVPDGVEVVGGDAADPRFTTAVTRGARVVYQTLNPPYSRWAQEFPARQAGVLAAARSAGARLVSMENVYLYGRPAGRPLTEARTHAAHTRKGKLRAGLLVPDYEPTVTLFTFVGEVALLLRLLIRNGTLPATH